MIFRRQFLIGAVLALAVSLNSGNARAASADDFIRSAGEKTFQSLNNEMTDKQRMNQFRHWMFRSKLRFSTCWRN